MDRVGPVMQPPSQLIQLQEMRGVIRAQLKTFEVEIANNNKVNFSKYLDAFKKGIPQELVNDRASLIKCADLIKAVKPSLDRSFYNHLNTKFSLTGIHLEFPGSDALDKQVGLDEMTSLFIGPDYLKDVMSLNRVLSNYSPRIRELFNHFCNFGYFPEIKNIQEVEELFKLADEMKREFNKDTFVKMIS